MEQQGGCRTEVGELKMEIRDCMGQGGIGCRTSVAMPSRLHITCIFVDPAMSGEELRSSLYEGNLIVLTRLPGVSALAAYYRARLEELFAPHDPEFAHEHFSPAEIAGLLGPWKPRFIHDPVSEQLVREIVQQAGCDPTLTHYDVPKPRTSFPSDHLTTGIAFAFPWHRDSWYAAPAQQINWWLPAYPVRPDNTMGFDLTKFGRPVKNDSHKFDYYKLKMARGTIAAQVTHEVQVRPRAVDHEAPQEVIILPAPGSILLFAGAHLHRSIPNTSGRSRFSIDFRTVDITDLRAGRGAPFADVYCTGTAIRDFHNVANGSPFDEEMVVDLFGAPPDGAILTFNPDVTTAAPSGN